MSDPAADAFLDYMTKVGMLVDGFARIEDTLRRVLWVQSGLNPVMFEALVGQPRTAELIEKLKKVIVANGISAEAEKVVADCFSQLAELIRLRDRILHFGGNPIDTGEFLIRTKPGKPSRVTGKRYDTFEPLELSAARGDLYTVEQRLLHHLDPSFPDDWWEGYRKDEAAGRTWLYKPPERRPAKNPRSRKAPQE